jgi:hypothetical protein
MPIPSPRQSRTMLNHYCVFQIRHHPSATAVDAVSVGSCRLCLGLAPLHAGHPQCWPTPPRHHPVISIAPAPAHALELAHCHEASLEPVHWPSTLAPRPSTLATDADRRPQGSSPRMFFSILYQIWELFGWKLTMIEWFWMKFEYVRIILDEIWVC